MTEKTMQSSDESEHRADDTQNPQGREDWIATCAYYLAEARGFTPVDDIGDWLQAEHAYTVKGESD